MPKFTQIVDYNQLNPLKHTSKASIMHINQSVLHHVAADINAAEFSITVLAIFHSNSQFYLNQDKLHIRNNENFHWIKAVDVFVWYGSA